MSDLSKKLFAAAEKSSTLTLVTEAPDVFTQFFKDAANAVAASSRPTHEIEARTNDLIIEILKENEFGQHNLSSDQIKTYADKFQAAMTGVLAEHQAAAVASQTQSAPVVDAQGLDAAIA